MKATLKDKIKLLIYRQARKYARRSAHKWRCTDSATVDDIAHEAYYMAVRNDLKILDRQKVDDPRAFARAVAYRRVRDAFRPLATEQRRFEDAFERFDHFAPEERQDPSDEGAGIARLIAAIDGEENLPEWRRLTRDTYERLPCELKRIATAFLTLWRPEDVRRALKLSNSVFYRRLAELRRIFPPCRLARPSTRSTRSAR